MASESTTYKINFEARATGIDDVKTKIQSIFELPALEDQITKPLRSGLNKLEGDIEQYKRLWNSITEGGGPEKASAEQLKQLDEIYVKILKRADRLGQSLQGIVFPPAVTEQLRLLRTELGKQIADLDKAKKAWRELNKITEHGTTETGGTTERIKKPAKNAVFQETATPEQRTVDGYVYADFDAYITKIEKLRAAGKLTEEQEREYAATIQATQAAIEDKLNTINQERDELTAKINVLTESTNRIKTDIQAIEESEAATAELSDEQRHATEQMSEMRGVIADLSRARTTDINAINAEQEANEEAAEAAEKAAKAAEARAKAAEKAAETERKAAEKATKAAAEAARQEDIAKEKIINRGATSAQEALTIAQRGQQATERNITTVGKAAKQVFTYGSILSLFRNIANRTLSTITEMDKALTDMTVVTDLSRSEAYALTGQLNGLAKETGKTTTEIADMTTKFLQQGKTVSEALTLTEAAAKAATIAGISGSESVDLLTNALNGFQMSADQALEVSDKFAALAAASATDYEELATALSKVAAQANLAGMSMDFTLGMLAKGVEVTREAPETIGTALKTVVARMRELSDYGKTLEDGADVNRVAAALNSVGIELTDESGQFRDLEAVLTEVGLAWDTLNTNQQANIAVAMAGTRQQSRFIAMMQDFERTQELVNISANSYGATLAQQEKYMGGIAAATNNLTSSYELLVQKLVQADGVVWFVNLLGDGVNLLAQAADNAWILYPLLALVAGFAASAVAHKIQEVQWEKELLNYERERHIDKQQQAIKDIQNAADLRKAAALEQAQTKKQMALNKKAAADEKISQLAELKRELRISKEKEKQAILDDDTLTRAQKTVALQDLAKDYVVVQDAAQKEINDAFAEQAAAEQEIKLAEQEIEQIKNKNFLTEEETLAIKNAQRDIDKTQLEQTGFLNQLLSSNLVIELAIKGVKWLISKRTKKQIAEEGALVATKTTGALADGASSAFKNGGLPGLIAGLALLAVAGIAAIAFAVAKESYNSDEKQEERLNQLASDIYNLQQSASAVKELGDEFDTLSSKISKTGDDMERLATIAQEVNEMAGDTVIDTNATYATQYKQIRTYQASLKYELEDTYKDQEKELKKQAGEARIVTGKEWIATPDSSITWKRANKYGEVDLEDFFSSDAQVESYKQIAARRLNLERFDNAQLQEALAQVAYNEVRQVLTYSSEYSSNTGFDWSALNSVMDETLLTNLSGALNDGDIALVADAWEQLTPTLREYLSVADPVLGTFEFLQTQTKGGATLLKKFNIQFDDLNTLNELFGNSQKTLIEWLNALDEVNADELTEGQRSVVAINKALELSAATYAKRRADLNNSTNKAYEEEINNITDINELKKLGYDQTSEYQRLAYEQELKELELKAKIQEINNAGSGDDKDELEDERNELDGELTELTNRLNEYKEAVSSPVDLDGILAIRDALGSVNNYTDITDAIKSLASSVERLGKAFDWTNLSLAEQLELMHDYPSLLKSMEDNVLDGLEYTKLLNEQFDKTVQEQEWSILQRENTAAQYMTILDENGEKDITFTIGGNRIGFSDLFGAEANSELQDMVLNADSDTVLSINKQLQELGFTQTAASEWWNQLIGDLQTNKEEVWTLETTKELGPTGLQDKELLTKIDDAKNAYNNAVHTVAELEKEYERLDEADQASRDEKLIELNNARATLVGEAINSQNNLNAQVEERLKQTGLDNYNELLDFKDGVVTINDGIFKTLTDAQQQILAGNMEFFEEAAQQYEEYGDSIWDTAQAIAQSLIDQEQAATDKQLEELEKRKEAYEAYFDELDSFNEEAEAEQSREDILKQIQALSGGADAASKSKIKELQSQLQELEDSEIERQREEQREAILQELDDQTEILNEKMENLNNSINALTQAIVDAIMDDGTLTDAERKAILAKYRLPGYSDGGLVTTTGPVMVHGTTTKPEAFLSADDTANIRALLDQLHYVRASMTDGIAIDGSDAANNNSITIENITIETNELNNDQDWRNAGQSLAEEFRRQQQARGINQNVNARYTKR